MRQRRNTYFLARKSKLKLVIVLTCHPKQNSLLVLDSIKHPLCFLCHFLANLTSKFYSSSFDLKAIQVCSYLFSNIYFVLAYWHCLEYYTQGISFISHNNLMRCHNYPYFADQEIKPLRCPGHIRRLLSQDSNPNGVSQSLYPYPLCQTTSQISVDGFVQHTKKYLVYNSSGSFMRLGTGNSLPHFTQEDPTVIK